jgi:hypothetical protein
MKCSLATSLEFGEFKQNAEAIMILLLCAAFFLLYFFVFVSSNSDGTTLRTGIVYHRLRMLRNRVNSVHVKPSPHESDQRDTNHLLLIAAYALKSRSKHLQLRSRQPRQDQQALQARNHTSQPMWRKKP